MSDNDIGRPENLINHIIPCTCPYNRHIVARRGEIPVLLASSGNITLPTKLPDVCIYGSSVLLAASDVGPVSPDACVVDPAEERASAS